MATTLTDLIPDLYVGLDTVSRELVGMIPSVTIDADVARAAVGQTVRSFVAPAVTADNIVPGVMPPDDGDQTILNKSMTITKSRRVPIRWTGEDERESGFNPNSIRQQQINQAIRTLCNEIEADVYNAAALGAGRVYVGADSTLLPFGTQNNWSDASNVRKQLVDNGAALNDISYVMDTGSGANLRSYQAAVNMYGSEELIRQGVLLDIGGMSLRETAAAQPFTVTDAALSVTAAATAKGATSVVVANDQGLGQAVVFTKGSAVQFDFEGNFYVVAEALTVADAGSGTLKLTSGLASALAAGTQCIIQDSGTRNVAFNRGAVVLASRLPSVPQGGDLAIDRTTIIDPRSGLSFEVAMYPQYRQMQWEISAAWGVGVIKPEHVVAQLHSTF